MSPHAHPRTWPDGWLVGHAVTGLDSWLVMLSHGQLVSDGQAGC